MPSATEPPCTSPQEALIPGPRARALLDLHDATLTATLRALTPSAFLSCFPLLAAHSPAALNALHAQMLARLGDLARADFTLILQERRVLENLNALEEVIGEARRRRGRGVDGAVGGAAGGQEEEVPPHLLPPDVLLAAHLAPSLTAARSRLNAKEQTLQSQNAALFSEVQGQWAEIEGLMHGVEGLVSDLEGAGGMMDGIESS